jgi:hypothetical protein
MNTDPDLQPATDSDVRKLTNFIGLCIVQNDIAGRIDPSHPRWDKVLRSFEDLLGWVENALRYVANSPASPGYEPYLVGLGVNRIAARAVAALAVRSGRRIAKESASRRPVFNAVRFLARPGRQKRGILRRAKLLLTAWEETSIIEAAFHEAGERDAIFKERYRDEFEFVALLKSVVEGGEANLLRLAEIAAAVAPFLSVRTANSIRLA